MALSERKYSTNRLIQKKFEVDLQKGSGSPFDLNN